MRHRAKPIWWIAVGLVVALAHCIDTPVERQRICEATSGRCFYVANTSAHGSGSFTNPYGLPDLPSATTPFCALASPALDSLQPGDILYFFGGDRKSTRLNSSHGYISYAVFCLKKKINSITHYTLKCVQY